MDLQWPDEYQLAAFATRLAKVNDCVREVWDLVLMTSDIQSLDQ
jgi:hypothetical protein